MGYKFKPSPASMIFAILGFIGAIYVVTNNSQCSSYSCQLGVQQCENCSSLLPIGIISIITIIVSVIKMFKKNYWICSICGRFNNDVDDACQHCSDDEN
jgi:hypothetical protein